MEEVVKLIARLLKGFYENDVDNFAEYMEKYISYLILDEDKILISDDKLDKMYYIQEDGKFLHMSIGSNVKCYGTYSDKNFRKILKRGLNDE